jgi:hypothetical protein
MANESGLAQRGLLLLGLMLVTLALAGFILFRPTGNPPLEESKRPELITLAIPQLGASFPASMDFGALAVLSQSLPSSPGWGVRYNATLVLARRGSAKTPLDVLSQMLDEDQQMRNFRVRLADGKDVADEYAARRTVLAALKAFDDWQQHKDAVQAVGNAPELQRVQAAIDKLTHSGNEVVSKEALRVASRPA